MVSNAKAGSQNHSRMVRQIICNSNPNVFFLINAVVVTVVLILFFGRENALTNCCCTCNEARICPSLGNTPG